jgi:hypothetical protein
MPGMDTHYADKNIDFSGHAGSEMLVKRLLNKAWTNVAVGPRYFSWVKDTFSLDPESNLKIPTIELGGNSMWVRNVRNTSLIIGVETLGNGSLSFFVKPDDGTRKIDHLSSKAPNPSFV